MKALRVLTDRRRVLGWIAGAPTVPVLACGGESASTDGSTTSGGGSASTGAGGEQVATVTGDAASGYVATLNVAIAV